MVHAALRLWDSTGRLATSTVGGGRALCDVNVVAGLTMSSVQVGPAGWRAVQAQARLPAPPALLAAERPCRSLSTWSPRQPRRVAAAAGSGSGSSGSEGGSGSSGGGDEVSLREQARLLNDLFYSSEVPAGVLDLEGGVASRRRYQPCLGYLQHAYRQHLAPTHLFYELCVLAPALLAACTNMGSLHCSTAPSVPASALQGETRTLPCHHQHSSPGGLQTPA